MFLTSSKDKVGSVHDIECNCCKQTISLVLDRAVNWKKSKEQPLLYLTTRGMILCASCTSAKGVLTKNGGNPIAVYNVQTAKIKAIPNILDIYKPSLDFDSIESGHYSEMVVNKVVEEAKERLKIEERGLNLDKPNKKVDTLVFNIMSNLDTVEEEVFE